MPLGGADPSGIFGPEGRCAGNGLPPISGRAADTGLGPEGRATPCALAGGRALAAGGAPGDLAWRLGLLAGRMG